jgi:hypothetical protein
VTVVNDAHRAEHVRKSSASCEQPQLQKHKVPSLTFALSSLSLSLLHLIRSGEREVVLLFHAVVVCLFVCFYIAAGGLIAVHPPLCPSTTRKKQRGKNGKIEAKLVVRERRHR